MVKRDKKPTTNAWSVIRLIQNFKTVLQFSRPETELIEATIIFMKREFGFCKSVSVLSNSTT